MRALLFLAVGLALAMPLAASAATIVIVNSDGAGEGFNDPTVVAPVGGNPGITLGQQRLNVFQAAANIWGGLLPSVVTIRVEARFNPQTCTPTSAVLGSAGPIQVFRDFPSAPVAATWYHVALANRLAGSDQSASNDITATFNSDLDNQTCLGATDWYYGLDGIEGTDIELLPVVLHELGHGLGFSTQVSLGAGTELGGFQDIYETFIRDNTSGLTWDQMSNAQRAASAVNTGNVVWNGPVTTGASPCFLSGTPTMDVNSPPALPPTIAIGTAAFGAALTEAGVTGDIVLVDDGSGVTSDACQALINGAAINGNIALIDRGTCSFTSKAALAQAAGAIAVIIADNVASGTPPALGGTDPSITIPVVSVTLADGNAIKAQLGGGVNVTIRADMTILAGADASQRVKLYAPNPVQGGSSISHFDVSASPNLLMEPAINSNLSSSVDLTLAHFTDIGWRTDCLSLSCPPSGDVAKDTQSILNFCVTNCGTDDTLHVTVTDTKGWCTPVDQKIWVLNGQQGCVQVTCNVPDTCDAVSNVITFSAKTRAGTLEECSTTMTSRNTPPVALCQDVVVSGAAGCSASVTTSQVNNGSFDPDGDAILLALEPPGPYGQGVTPVSLIVTDDCGDADTCQAQVTVTCGPLLQVIPADIVLSSVAQGDTACDSVCVINVGDEALNVSSVTGCDTGQFFLDLAGFATSIAPGDTSKFLVCFAPTQSGADTCEVTIVTNGGTEAVDVDGSSPTLGVEDGPLASGLLLGPIVPTPFAREAEVRFALSEADRVSVEVFDFQGRRVRTVLGGEARAAGEQSVRWDGADERGVEVAGGIYFVRVSTVNHGSKVVRAVRLSE